MRTLPPETRRLLRHFLAALAYRTEKPLANPPEGFGDFDAGGGTRTPVELVRHMTALVGRMRTFMIGGAYEALPPGNLDTEAGRFREAVHHLSGDLEGGLPLEGVTLDQLLQGPLADAMTHAGQLAMLRRLAGDPVVPENFMQAPISPDPASRSPES